MRGERESNMEIQDVILFLRVVGCDDEMEMSYCEGKSGSYIDAHRTRIINR
jgi:hypothetical protein